MNKKDFIKKFPDVKVQKLETKYVFSRGEVQETVAQVVQGLETGLVYYEYDSRTITIFTSDIMYANLQGMLKDSSVLDPNRGIVGTIVSEQPYILSCQMCVSVDFEGKVDAYDCEFFM